MASLSVTITGLTREALYLDVVLVNTRVTDIFVAAVLFRQDNVGNRDRDPALLFAARGSGERVVIGKWVPSVPEGRKVESEPVPYFTKLEPGKRWENACELPLPVRWFGFYGPPPTPLREPRMLPSLGFNLGILDSARFPPGAGVIVPSMASPPGAPLECDSGFGKQLQEFLTSEIALPAPGIPSFI
ncbi:hypothetical protein [Neoroseomonas lacus]|uniref:Uncharacterized protein n=1 Tax=Neoroseomonas lacus TaxID=287609 RepID=A0A917KHY9_9PROT|nr:hypothetical protein [Neoroseomonas lacus]GGJ10541.1 hypothetical protein GCM10011320_17050 [Neoroseomonas lacus]